MRLKNIVLTELIHDRLVAYEELERVMNRRDSIDSLVSKSKYYLKKIVKLNAMINEWQEIMQSESKTDLSDLAELQKNKING